MKKKRKEKEKVVVGRLLKSKECVPVGSLSKLGVLLDFLNCAVF